MNAATETSESFVAPATAPRPVRPFYWSVMPELWENRSLMIAPLVVGGFILFVLIAGAINTLNQIIDVAIPRDKQEGGTYIIPGHGRVADEADVVEYRDMVVIIRDRVQDLLNKGRSVEQIKAAKVTFDYDRRYATPGWTGDQFIEAVAATLKPAPAPTTRRSR